MIEPDINERMARFSPSQVQDDVDPIASEIASRAAVPTSQPTMAMPDVDPVAAQIAEKDTESLDAAVLGARAVNPDEAARAIKVGRKVGIPAEVARADMQRAEQQAYLADLRSKDLLRTDPVMANFLANKEFAETAHDDIDVLGTIRPFMLDYVQFYVTGMTPGMRRGFERGQLVAERGEIGGRAMAGLAQPEDFERATKIRDRMRELVDVGFLGATTEVIAQNLAQIRGIGTFTVGGAAVGSAVPVLGTIAGGALGATAGVVATTGQMEAGNLYLDLREEGVEDDVAIPVSVAGGFLNGVIEVVGMKIAAKPFQALAKRFMAEAVSKAVAQPTTRAALAAAGKGYILQVGTEASEEALQEVVIIAGEEIAKAASGIDSETGLRQATERVVDAFVQGAMGSAILGGIGPGANLYVDLSRAANTERQQVFFEKLATVGKDSRLAKRSPEAYERFLEAQAKDGPAETIYVDGRTAQELFAQSGLTAAQLEEVLPGIKAQVDEAVATGGDVTIQTARFGARLANTDLGNALLPHMRLDPDAMSLTEAQEFQARRQEVVKDAERILTEKESTSGTFVQEAREIEDTLASQIQATGQMDERAARSSAQFMRDFYVTQAASMGLTPKQVYERFPVRVEGEGMATPATPLEQAAQMPKVDGVSLRKDIRRYAKGEINARDFIAEANLFGLVTEDEVTELLQQDFDFEMAGVSTRGGGMMSLPGEMGKRGQHPLLALVRKREKERPTSVTRRDAQYLDAVQRGDMSTAKQMVEEAAWMAGYKVGPLFHGGITKIDVPRGVRGIAASASLDRSTAEYYARTMEDAYLRGEAILPEGAQVIGPNISTWYGRGEIFDPRNPAHVQRAGLSGLDLPFTWETYELDFAGGMSDVARAIRDAGFSGYFERESVSDYFRNIGFFSPNDIKSANPVTRDEQGNIVPLSRRFDITSAKLFEQAAMPPGPNAPSIGVAQENKLGFWPALRVMATQAQELPEKPLILTGTTNKNAAKQLSNVDDILGRFPDAGASVDAWTNMLSYAFATSDVPVPPYAFIRDINGNGSFERLSTLTEGQIADASRGFANAREFRQAYINGELDVITTGKLFLWSFLSRGVSPYTQESLFIDAFEGADSWIKKAAQGDFTEADFPAYEKWAKSVAPQGSGQPGAGATHNLNAFGKNFLMKMGAIGPDGKSNLQRLHEMMSDPNQTGQKIRREFSTFGEGVGIDNKVVSFTLLVAGFNDVMVLDRVQIRQLWDDGRFAGTNLYDGVMSEDGKKLAGSSLNAITEGVRGILVYEAIERQLAGRVNELYARLGRPEDASIGRYHWETWVAYSQQEAAHATLDAILLDAKGDDQAIAKVSGKQGEYGAYEYGAQYNRDRDGIPWFRYVTPLGGTYDFSVASFRQFLSEIKKAGNKVVPAKFKVSESGNAPWYTRPEVNRQRLEEQAAKWADRGGGTGEGARLAEQAAADADAIRARSGAGVQPAVGVGVLEQAAPGPARGGFDPRRLTTILNKTADLSTFLHESAHAFLTFYEQVAQMPDAPARIVNDLDEVLRWAGIAGDTPQARLATWNGMTLDQKRKAHEQFAYSFEVYLFEGKAPSAEMQGMFERFSAWLKRIYRSIRDDLNAIYRREFGEDLPLLTGEVRQVMDRMLATDEQIARQAAINEMKPMFQTQAESGMSDAEWAAYQQMQQEAIEASVIDMNVASMRQMQWLGNARSRVLREVQKKHDARRKEVAVEIAAEVRLEPVYRAMTYLRTGKFVDADGAEVAVEGPHRLDTKRVKKLYETVPTAASLEAVRATGMPMPAVIAPDIAKLGTGKGGMMGVDGLDPDLVAETFGYSSGDEMIRALIAARPMKEIVAERTDAEMLRRFGDMTSPEAIEAEVQAALHNEARARFVAVELRYLSKATEPARVMVDAAKQVARDLIAGKRVRDVRPSDFVAAEARAARDASRIGSPVDAVAVGRAAYTRTYNERIAAGADELTAVAEATTASVEAARMAQERTEEIKARYGADPEQARIRAKRAQLYQNQLAAEALRVKAEVDKQVKYLRRVLRDENVKRMGAQAADQVAGLLARFEVAAVSLKRLDERKALTDWLAEQEAAGLVPDIAPEIANEARRVNYREMKVSEFRDLVDAVRQIEFIGKNEQKLRLAEERAAFEEKRDEIVTRIRAAGKVRGLSLDPRTPLTGIGRAAAFLRGFAAQHLKAASIARVLDGGKEDGPLWNAIIRTANDASDMETTMRAKAALRLGEILKPVFALGGMGGKGMHFPSIGRSLNREARLAIALNMGNDGNRQRLLDGEGWTLEQIQPVLESLTEAEWQAVQQVWDFIDGYRPEIAAKERRLYGKEPTWVTPVPFTVRTVDGKEVNLQGGYYPIKYDPVASDRVATVDAAEEAKRDLQGAYTAATTRRSFVKARAKEVVDRPILYTLDAAFSGVNDVIHDLAWHEWLISTNRLLRDVKFANAVRETRGPEFLKQLRDWTKDNATGGRGQQVAGESVLSWLRQGISASGLGFNINSAALQITGFNQSIVRVGAKYVGQGITQFATSPFDSAKMVSEKSQFMAERGRTQFREINEIKNRVRGQTEISRRVFAGTYFLMMNMQRSVDIPTWLGAYQKALDAGKNDATAVALADQAVRDSQGSGLVSDLAAVERGGPAMKLFTVFYSYMNTVYNMAAVQTMTARGKGKLAADYAMLFVVPVVLGYAIKSLLQPNTDDEEFDPEALARKLAAEELSYMMGTMIIAREFGGAAQLLTGAEGVRMGYGGPAGLRAIGEVYGLATQAGQLEFDRAFRRSAVNTLGAFTGLPAAQINRTIDGIEAVVEGEVEGVGAVVAPLTGVQR